MQGIFCFTTDLEPDFLSSDSHEVLTDERRIAQIAACLKKYQIRPTIFATGAMLGDDLAVKERLASLDPEYALHSYSHRNEEPDSEREICLGKEAFYDYFGYLPEGYRAPSGIISRQGVSLLEREGFKYDASVFPTWRPELGYNFRKLPQVPFRYEELGSLVELPFAVVPKLRVVISLSFLKLFGFGFYRVLFDRFGLPDILVFDSHLYDFFLTSPVRDLSVWDWRSHALSRNQAHVFSLLDDLLSYVQQRGYRFVTMSDLYDHVKHGALPSVSKDALLDASAR